MQHNFKVLVGNIDISPLRRATIEPLRNLRNKERLFFLNASYISEQQQSEWFEKYLATPNDYMFEASTLDKPRIFIGAAALYNVNEEERTAEFGRLVIDREKYGGRGLGADIVKTICEIGFEQLHITKIYLEVYSDNSAAIKTYIKTGFCVADVLNGDNHKTLRMCLAR